MELINKELGCSHYILGDICVTTLIFFFGWIMKYFLAMINMLQVLLAFLINFPIERFQGRNIHRGNMTFAFLRKVKKKKLRAYHRPSQNIHTQVVIALSKVLLTQRDLGKCCQIKFFTKKIQESKPHCQDCIRSHKAALFLENKSVSKHLSL